MKRKKKKNNNENYLQKLFFFDFCKFRIEGEQKGKYVKGEFVFQISFPVDISQKKKKISTVFVSL